jgi:LytS/YehU family sensor histidine kinase
VSLALSGIWLLIINIILENIFKADITFLYVFNTTMGIRFAVAFLIMACITLAGLLWRTQQKQAEDEYYKRETERIAKDAELNKLRQQLQPHFLFNSLNSISALTGTQPEKARHMIQQLSEFLRGTLKKEDAGPISIEEELQQLELYLDIEKLRFGYRLKTTVDAAEGLMHMNIPALLLQPIVENAIKFGLYDTIDEVEILITLKNINNTVEITVSNPFDETTALPVKGTGFGLSSVRRRLFLLFGRQDLLQTKQENGKFITIITIPQTT